MIKAPKFIVSTVVIIICQITIMSCAFAKDRTYSGIVIDAETKGPIKGAVVVAVWDEERAGIAGPDTRFKDVKEALTDKDGKWSIVGPEGDTDKLIPGLLTLTGVYMTRTPEFIVFKPSYCPWPKGFYINACKGKLKPEGNAKVSDGEAVELPKLINKEDRMMAIPSSEYGTEPNRRIEFLKKQKEFLKLLNMEERNLGLSENKMYKEIIEK
jgi:hypothetical protein